MSNVAVQRVSEGALVNRTIGIIGRRRDETVRSCNDCIFGVIKLGELKIKIYFTLPSLLSILSSLFSSSIYAAQQKLSRSPTVSPPLPSLSVCMFTYCYSIVDDLISIIRTRVGDHFAPVSPGTHRNEQQCESIWNSKRFEDVWRYWL
jgi:hypothetical protein